MSIYPIVTLPDQRLRAKTYPITQFDAALQTLIDAMFETMYEAQGIGLAAPQIGINQQLAVIDVTSDRATTWVLINPEIVWKADEALLEEGCLSIPGVQGRIPRALKLGLQALDRRGQPYEIEADGLLAHCIQHELDHLSGKLFIDYLSPLKQQLALKKLKKAKRHRVDEKA